MTPSFLIDTANADDIQRILDKIMPHVSKNSFAGITTNPSALAKINCNSIGELEILTYKLSRMVSKIRNDNRNDNKGLIHVQLPNSNANTAELQKWIKFLNEWGDGKTKLAIKLPPIPRIIHTFNNLSEASESITANVTGIADAATALRCLSGEKIDFVSIIPGRMEEVGIDATQHITTVQQRIVKWKGYGETQKVITGSMRTLDGLARAIKLQTLPTIGTKVWDLMDNEYCKNFNSLWNEIDIPDEYIVPITDQRNIDLTNQFFEQMNGFGSSLYKELQELVK